MRPSATMFFVLTLALPAADAAAQRRDLSRAGLPRDEARRIQELVDHPDSRHYDGPIRLADDLNGPVIVWDGDAIVAGRITGALVVIDGDVRFEPGAVVTGDVTVVGGAMAGVEQARVAGNVAIYGEGFDRLAQAERRHRDADRHRDWTRAREHWRTDFGDADFSVRLGHSYNRVEGLPVEFGPRILTDGPAPTRIEAFGIWRTDIGSPFDTDGMGYRARVEQWTDADGTLRLGGTVRSEIQAIESSHLSDLEASLATVVLHDDYRDYFERTGWSAYLRVAPEHSPFDAMVEYRDERHETAPVRSPWTLFNGDELWRAQPLAAEGDIRLLTASARLDLARDHDDDFAASGWFIDLEATHRLDGELTLSSIPAVGGDVNRTIFDDAFTTAVLDIRRYQRVGRNATLGLRAVGGGALDEQALPPQFQHALGGPGSLPGYARFAADCGARQTFVRRSDQQLGQEFYATYGCDRFALFQAEYRGGFDLDFGGHDDDDHGFWNADFDSPSWIVFFDAARGWSYGTDGTGLVADTGELYDAGAGIILGDFGIYGAVPLTERSRGFNVFIRLGPRF